MLLLHRYSITNILNFPTFTLRFSNLRWLMTSTPEKEIIIGKKNNVALIIGYVGSGYFGLQMNNQNRNSGFPTIEEVVIEGLKHACAIRTDHAADIRLMRFQRAARTDKGVHAACNVLSLKLNLMNWCSNPKTNADGMCSGKNKEFPENVKVIRPPEDRADLISKLNSYIGPASDGRIIVYDCVRVCQSFNSKNSCDSRSYCYVLPTYALANVADKSMIDCSYRIDEETLSRARLLFGKYRGAHRWMRQVSGRVITTIDFPNNFHNFTVGKSFTDPSSVRNIIDIELGDPFEASVDGKLVEMCMLKIHGQSFMLHQIRKMVAFVCYIMRGVYIPLQNDEEDAESSADEKFFDLAFTSTKLSMIKAPADPLFLNRLHYRIYNERYGNDGIHRKVLDPEDGINEKIERFKKEKIIPKINEQLCINDTMLEWMSYTLERPCTCFSPFWQCHEFTGIGQASTKLRRSRADQEQDEQEKKAKIPKVETDKVFFTM